MQQVCLPKGLRLPDIPASRAQLAFAQYSYEFLLQVKARGVYKVLYKHCYNGKLTNYERDELAICQRIAKQAVINRTK